jgi:cell shape-determining protein MreC
MRSPPRRACGLCLPKWPLTGRVVVLVIVLAYLLVLLRQGYSLSSSVAVLATAAAVVQLVAPIPRRAVSS